MASPARRWGRPPQPAPPMTGPRAAGAAMPDAGPRAAGAAMPDAGPTGPTSFVKTCPRCESTLFADMDQCFECLFDYRNPSLDYAGSGARHDAASAPAEPDPVPFDAAVPDLPPLDGEGVSWSYSDPVLPDDPGPTALDEPDDWGGEAEVVAVDVERATHSGNRDAAHDGERLEADARPRPIVSDEVVRDAAAPPLEESVGEGERMTEADGSDPGPSQEADDSDSGPGQDAGLFPEPVPPAKGASEPRAPVPSELRLGVLVHWRGLEMTASLASGRLTIGRDRGNDIVIASFDVPAVAVAVEPSDEGAELRLLADGVEARLDGARVEGAARLGAGQEIELFGARLSLVRLD